MAKYSTGGGSRSEDGDSCELCGAESGSLRLANVAGAQLRVCPSCAPHDDTAHRDKKRRERVESDGEDRGGESRRKRAARNLARVTDRNVDTSHWVKEGTNYDDDPLPYLVSGYGDVVADARQDAGLTREELADELGVPENDVLAVEQGRATNAGVGGGLIAALESLLGVTLEAEN